MTSESSRVEFPGDARVQPRLRTIDPRATRWQPASGRQQWDRRGERGLGGRISWICGRLGKKPSLLVTALPLRVEGGAVHSFTETTLTGGLAPTLQESSKHFLPKAVCCSRRLCSGILGLLSRFLTSLPPLLNTCVASDFCLHHLPRSSQYLGWLTCPGCHVIPTVQ